MLGRLCPVNQMVQVRKETWLAEQWVDQTVAYLVMAYKF